MKIPLKTKEDIDIMREGGKITSAALQAVKAAVRPGVTSLELDAIAEKTIREMGGEPSFMKVPGYKYTTCMCINDVVVHGIPTSAPLVAGDVVGIDVGAYWGGFHTDVSYSVIAIEGGFWEPTEDVIAQERKNWKVENGVISRISAILPPDPNDETASLDEKKRFLTVGKLALLDAMPQAVVANHIGDISYVLQSYLVGSGYGVVKELIGHGVGRELHEPPQVPGRGKRGEGIVIKSGMVLAIEAIYTMGNPEVVFKNRDGWTIATDDYSLAGLYEASISITELGWEVLTGW